MQIIEHSGIFASDGYVTIITYTYLHAGIFL